MSYAAKNISSFFLPRSGGAGGASSGPAHVRAPAPGASSAPAPAPAPGGGGSDRGGGGGGGAPEPKRMKAASLVGYFGAGSGWLKVAAEKAEAERMRKALVCLKAAALVKEPYSPVLLASMSFHCRTFAGPKPQVNYSQKLNMAPAEN